MKRLPLPILFVSAAAVGIFAGVGLFTFRYAEGLSYFSRDPMACVNCHIMQPQFDSWQKAGHHGVATCVDCHLPQDLIPKYFAKADNGFRHSKGFTFQDFHEPIFLNPRSEKILEKNCLRCHEGMTRDTALSDGNPKAVSCVHCHADVGHGDKTGMGRFEKKEIHRGDHP